MIRLIFRNRNLIVSEQALAVSGQESPEFHNLPPNHTRFKAVQLVWGAIFYPVRHLKTLLNTIDYF